jgi:hypothetical protein
VQVVGIKTVLKVAGTVVCLSGVSVVANSAAIVYDLAGGEVTLSATNGNNGNSLLAAGSSVPLTAPSQLTFDSAALTVPSFEFTDQGTADLALQGALAGDTLEITDLTAVPDSVNYSSSATGTGPFNFTLGALDVTGTFEVVTAANKIVAGPTAFSHDDPTLTGQITLSGNTMTNLTLNGVTLAAVTISGTPVTIAGDVEFSGVAPVPVPAAIWLLGSGLMGLSGSALVRRRRANL